MNDVTMKYYIEITLLENSAIDFFNLWSKIFQQIHLGLVEIQDEQGRVPIGVSFPEYFMGEKFSLLGNKLRLFASDEAMLIKFNVLKWLEKLIDYIHLSDVQKVVLENIAGFAIYKREQIKINRERLARRYAKRHNLEYGKALDLYKDRALKKYSIPFIRLKSLSTGNNFCLGIKKILVNNTHGVFYNSYGLSASSSLPEF